MVAEAEKFDYLEASQAPDEIGRLGPYRVLSALGRGGMGQVFRAEDTRLERVVALKVMNKRFATTPNSKERFIREARAMAAIKHDNVVTVYEVGEHAGVPFMAMELLKGQPLEAITQSDQRLNLDRIIEYAIQMARGLAAAHARGIVHRDIKPANIWIEESTHRIKILDFGLALASSPTDTLTGRGTVVGTPGYLSPEQAQGELLDDRCDLYSLGVVLYELICGRVPFIAKTVPELLIKIVAHQPLSPDKVIKDLPKPYADLIMRLLAKEARDRVQSAKELEELLISTHDTVQDQSRAAMQIVTGTAQPPLPKSAPPLLPKKIAESGISPKIWIPATIVSATLLFVIGYWAIASTRPVASKPMAPVASQERTERAVMAASLEPLRLSDVTGSTSVPLGEQARFRLKLTNTAPDGVRDPRVVNAKAKLVAQIRTFLKRDNDVKRPAPTFPKKMSANQLPAPGQSSDIEILFSTAGLLAGDYEVSFDLQSPKGGSVMQVSSKFSVGENLQTSDLLGFDILRTSQGRGADTTVKKGATEDLGGRAYISAHQQPVNNETVAEHTYLRFDLKARAKADGTIDRVILLLSGTTDGLKGKATLNAYGMPKEFKPDWIENGDQRLTWDSSPSNTDIASLPFLGQAEIDNTSGQLENQTDNIRIFGTALDDYVRQSGELATILVVRTNDASKESRFVAREGSVDRAPALAIRTK